MTESVSSLAASVLELAERATAGPWGASGHGVPNLLDISDDPTGGAVASVARWLHGAPGDAGEAEANAAFIALCRTAAPALARAVQEQAAEVERLRGVCIDAAKHLSVAAMTAGPRRNLIAYLRAAAQDRQP